MDISLNSIKSIYLVGIGGIGMSALARYFAHNKLFVAGYDSTPTVLTKALEEEGIAIHYTDSIEDIPSQITDEPKDTLVIYTPAVPKNHGELNYFKTKGFTLMKRAQALGVISKEYTTAAVAGTHGKTSTSTLLAHILNGTDQGCNGFLGGISKNFSSNLILSNSQRMVVEADEFDRSFHSLAPDLAIITSTDADHLDIYNTHAEVIEAFSIFISKIRDNGTLIIKKGLEHMANKQQNIKVYTYSATHEADFCISKISQQDGLYTFTLKTPFGKIESIELGVLGKYNVENAVAASAAALVWGTDIEPLKKGLKSFKGITRRFDLRYKGKKSVYIDDYAHHPAELKAAITSVRAMFPDRKITGVFQPHLYSRTKDFAADFAESLSLLDELLLLDIYPAREEPIPGVTSEIILNRVNCNFKKICSLNSAIEELKNMEIDILITMGAGNIDKLVDPIARMLKEKEDAE
jgi:UDP-N-acetylmuramate--alanine ligase